VAEHVRLLDEREKCPRRGECEHEMPPRGPDQAEPGRGTRRVSPDVQADSGDGHDQEGRFLSDQVAKRQRRLRLIERQQVDKKDR